MKNLQASDGNLYAFIPKRLTKDASSLLYNFPHTVLFAKWKQENGQTVMGHATYRPVTKNVIRTDDGRYLLRYKNQYGAKGKLIIYYDTKKGRWSGEKFIAGEFAGSASGDEWQGFFFHLTILGLTNGEPCAFDITPLEQNSNKAGN
jgi:hypothetical protein